MQGDILADGCLKADLDKYLAQKDALHRVQAFPAAKDSCDSEDELEAALNNEMSSRKRSRRVLQRLTWNLPKRFFRS